MRGCTWIGVGLGVRDCEGRASRRLDGDQSLSFTPALESDVEDVERCATCYLVVEALDAPDVLVCDERSLPKKGVRLLAVLDS